MQAVVPTFIVFHPLPERVWVQLLQLYGLLTADAHAPAPDDIPKTEIEPLAPPKHEGLIDSKLKVGGVNVGIGVPDEPILSKRAYFYDPLTRILTII
jgi:hypothetical protein